MPTIFISGMPAGQGNLRRNPSGGLYEAGKATRPWKAAIAAAVDEWLAGAPATRHEVHLLARFQFVRPLSHLKKSGGLASGAPPAMTRNPDIDKLCRALLDALTGVLYVDDALVSRLTAYKEYGDRAGLELSWHVVEPEPPAAA